MRNFFCHLSQRRVTCVKKMSELKRQMCKQDNCNCTRAHNFKARTTNRGKGLTVTLSRTLCGVPWSAPRPPHACHSHGVWAHPPSSRIQQTVEKLDTLWCPVPAVSRATTKRNCRLTCRVYGAKDAGRPKNTWQTVQFSIFLEEFCWREHQSTSFLPREQSSR